MPSRRDFLKTSSASIALGAFLPPHPRGPEILVRRAVRPLVISDYSGFEFKNGGTENAVARAFRLIVKGDDVLDALIAGVNYP